MQDERDADRTVDPRDEPRVQDRITGSMPMTLKAANG